MRVAFVFCVLGGVAVAFIGANRFHPPAVLRDDPISELKPLRPYAVDVLAGTARCDLDFSHGCEYALIVSSLAEADQSFTVRFESTPIEKVVPCAGRPILPLKTIANYVGCVKAKRGRTAYGVQISKRQNEPHRSDGVLPGIACRPSDRGASALGLDTPYTAAKTRRFFIHVTDGSLDDPRHYARIDARLLADGKNVRLYLDSRQSPGDLYPGVAREIVRILDSEIIPHTRRRLGEFRDVDGDGKFTVLLTPWLGRLQGGRVSLGGFVRGTDFSPAVKPPFGNQCDMLTLNSTVQPGDHLRALLAHEFAHAVIFSERLPSANRPHGLPEEDDWLNEAIAHLAENLHHSGWSNLDYRISRYWESPQAYPLVVANYYSAGLWRNHGCRGAAYLFLRWCVDQFGEGLLRTLIQSPFSGRLNLQRSTGLPFEELYRRWTLAGLPEVAR
ncbi:MAG: hypothetical protein IID45_07940, partial [Planctomycetes bacterium]|nr:hypothetical protein [Planctomycetota bacterium]